LGLLSLLQKKENLSTYEKERQKLEAKIKEMEEANLASKDWVMQGEVNVPSSNDNVDIDGWHKHLPMLLHSLSSVLKILFFLSTLNR